ncbi:hypothetical protein EJ03DRAFT_356215 [Teratosphaeria nubilosa]|uniref:Uncharacterized protein n=1 Tax=Teratosphaeria nubilosa TaxID=161662 RepID=A0A6G1KV52_9PEZI|nr:hypothetical protein EJ03DRAFT_356215 [Teratosphaeria nubilosa]
MPLPTSASGSKLETTVYTVDLSPSTTPASTGSAVSTTDYGVSSWQDATSVTSATWILWLYVVVSFCVLIVLMVSGTLDHKLNWKRHAERQSRNERLDLWRGTSFRESRIDSPHLGRRHRREIATLGSPVRPVSIAETDLGLGGEVQYYPHAGYASEAPIELQTRILRLADRSPTALPGSDGMGDMSGGRPRVLPVGTDAQVRDQMMDQAREEQEMAWRRIQAARSLEASLGRISALGFA